ncbi:MAG: transport flavoprotein, partial [Actinomycetia bacterium]|nr:transport flavoprotein [Actinomycetes bacterium]
MNHQALPHRNGQPPAARPSPGHSPDGQPSPGYSPDAQPPDAQSPGAQPPGGQPDLDGEHYRALVIGGGQAGLSMSYCLGQRGIGHLVLESRTVAHEWRDRRW